VGGRPQSRTAIGNLFLAGDWVCTDINVTTMEGANEGARQAVNALLDAAGSVAPRCSLRGLCRPPEFENLKSVDRARYRESSRISRQGLAHSPDRLRVRFWVSA
jgi:hypothetical protein